MAVTTTIDVRITDLDEFNELVRRLEDRFERLSLALGDAEAWLDDRTPLWVREEVAAARVLCRPETLLKGEG